MMAGLRPIGSLNGEAELDIRHARTLDAYFRTLRQPWPDPLWPWFRRPEGMALREAIFALEAAIRDEGPRLKGDR